MAQLAMSLGISQRGLSKLQELLGKLPGEEESLASLWERVR